MEKIVLQIDRVTAEISHKKYLQDISLTICKGDFWTVLGSNASGKSGLGQLLADRLKVVEGDVLVKPICTGYVSFEKHSEVVEQLIRNDDTDALDMVDQGPTVQDFICSSDNSIFRRSLFDKNKNCLTELSSKSYEHIESINLPKFPRFSETDDIIKRARSIAQKFGIDHLLDRGIKFLSTGEIRKAIICQSLVAEPELLVLDEPYDGIDTSSKLNIADAINSLNEHGVTVVLILNRLSQVPKKTTHMIYMSDCRIELKGEYNDILPKLESMNQKSVHQKSIDHLSGSKMMPEQHSLLSVRLKPENSTALIKMVDVTVKYGVRTVLDKISWEVKPGEHWKISGPNGAGKSTLLSLVNGDNPQAYCNHIELFGRRRGTGESVWDIKRHTAIVSSGLQLDYRVSASTFGVVVSGFFDSIGIYRQPSKEQQNIAIEWLSIIGMTDHAKKPFKRLSYGEQRMVLIARAMVKQPELLILDEPCQGLDDINRQNVLDLIDHIGKSGKSTILYVTHHDEDYLECINRIFYFIPNSSCGNYTYSIS